MATLAASGVERIVGLVLAPHFSALSVGEYLGRARAAADEAGRPFAGIESWAVEPAYIDFLAAQVRRSLDGMPANTKVLFTAHSLPRRVLDAGDPYPGELRATAAAVAGSAGLAPWAQWSVGWQSAGRTPEPWIGPDVLEVIDELGPSENADGLLVCPCGFVADHLEVLYDLDIEARRRAEDHRLVFRRTASMNDDPAVIAALAERVSRRERSERHPTSRAPASRRAMGFEGAEPRAGTVRRVLVVGGGISGLTTAFELAGLVDGDDVVIEVREATDRLGGKLHTTPFAGLPGVDEGADAFLARVPDGTDLAHRLDLDLTSPTAATAAVWHDGLHPIPEGLLLGVPTGIARLATTGLLSVRGQAPRGGRTAAPTPR